MPSSTPSDSPSARSPKGHAFLERPHRTLVVLTAPVLVSLIAEPLTGLVDTFFVSRLGAAPLGALALATTLLSSVVWVFNFLGIGTQTDVAAADGSGDRERGSESTYLALALALMLGAGLCVAGWFAAPVLLEWMGASDAMLGHAVGYLRIRLIGAPAMLVMLAGFGAFRGLQDMRTPLWIALAVNAGNAALDPLLIFGAGPVPAFGVEGAALASSVSQWGAAVWVYAAVRQRFSPPARLPWRRSASLLVVGRDLVFRTALLLAFQVLAVRKSALIGVGAVAAHQVIRQIWMFSAFVLDAFAASAQSLVGYFLGADRVDLARRVAWVACVWAFGTGFVLAAAMILGQGAVERAFLPLEAVGVFAWPWLALACSQPLNALSFVTDGLHWGSRDYRYLRNAMFASTATGAILLSVVDVDGENALLWVWSVTAVWITVRALFGVARIWPGIGRSPYRV